MITKSTNDLRERDIRQRAIGCFGFSAIAHVTFLTTLLLSGIFAKTFHQEHSRKAAQHAQSGLILDSKKPGSRKLIESVAKHEVLLADVADPNAVALPPAARPIAKTEPPPPKKAIEVLKPKPIAALPERAPRKAKAAPKLVAAAKPAKIAPPEDEAFQPASIPDANSADRSKDPEMLSPIIAEDPQGADHALVAAGPSSDELAAAEAAAAVTAPTQAPSTEPAAAASQSGQDGSDAGSKVIDASTRQPLSGNPLPAYPQADRLNGNQGTTVLLGHVGADGQMSDVKVEKSSGSKSLDQASVAAFKNWRFAPGEDAQVRKAITFSLNGEAKMVPARLGSR